MEMQTEETSQANGVATQTVETKTETAVKPWIAAGYKSRSEWRAAKKAQKKPEETAKTIKKTEKKLQASSLKKPAKVKTNKPAKKEAKASSKKNEGEKKNYPRTPKERREAHERTLAFFRGAAKREEPNKDEATILKAVRKGTITTIAKMAELFTGAPAKCNSRVRNALRWLRASKKFKKVESGTYQRVA